MKLPLLVALLLLIASTVAMATRRFKLPYTVSLVLAGLLLSVLRGRLFPATDLGVHLTPELLFDLLLPILVYEAAFHIEVREFVENWKAIGMLAIVGAATGIFVAGAMIFGVLNLIGYPVPWGVALMISTILAATDPIGVIALLRETGAPRKLAVLMEGESLLNDAVAVVAFTVVLVSLGLVPTQLTLTAPWLFKYIGWEIVGALALGGSIGFFFAWLTSKVDDHLIEITLSNIAAFASFLVAQSVHSSGVIACLIAGMLGGNFGAKYGMSPTTRIAVTSYWEYIAFVANSIVFLLIGLDVNAGRLVHDLGAIALVWLILLVSRALFVSTALPPVAKLEGGLPRGARWVIGWGGVRGSIAIVLALGLPLAMPLRSLVVNTVFGASLLTILVQSLTMGRLLRRFGLSAHQSDSRTAVVELRGRLRSLHAAREALERQRRNGAIDGHVFDALSAELAAEQQALQSQRAELGDAEHSLHAMEIHRAQERLLAARKEALHDAAGAGQIDRATLKRLIGEIDEQLHQMHSHAAPQTAPGEAEPS